MKDSKDCEIRGLGLHTCKVRYMLFECFEKLVKKSKISLVDAFVRIFSSFVLFFWSFWICCFGISIYTRDSLYKINCFFDCDYRVFLSFYYTIFSSFTTGFPEGKSK